MRMLPWTLAFVFGFSAVVQAKPPRCDEEGAGGAVRIDVIVAEKRVEPKECTVGPGTKIVWFLDDENQAFEADFGKASPDPAKGTKIKSARVLYHQEAKITARKVTEETTYDYALIVNGEEYDPAIIIDPNKN